MTARATFASTIGSAAAAAVASRLPAPAVPGWQRSNYRGRTVDLSGGAAVASGVLAGLVFAGPLRRSALIAAGAAALAGGYDDLLAPRAESKLDKGLAGHWAALRSGRLSGGAVKVALIGAGSVIAARALPSSDDDGVFASGVRAVVIAGSANLLNLFDLRPGRAAKLALFVCGAAASFGRLSPPLGAVAGACAVTLPGELGERTMLGDLGANTLGALVGVALANGTRRTRAAAAVAIVGLTLLSERVSFTKVIAGSPGLRWLDDLGRLEPTVVPRAEPASPRR